MFRVCVGSTRGPASRLGGSLQGLCPLVARGPEGSGGEEGVGSRRSPAAARVGVRTRGERFAWRGAESVELAQRVRAPAEARG